MQMQIQEKQGLRLYFFKEKFKLRALKEAKRALKGTVFNISLLNIYIPQIS